MKNKKQIMRKVCVVYGKWEKDSDFVLEPVCEECNEDGKECYVCKDFIYIKEVEK